MKFLVAISATLLAALALAQTEEKYSRRYDNIDVDTIFRSSRLLNNYVDCLLDKKPCPPEGKDLKRKFWSPAGYLNVTSRNLPCWLRLNQKE